MGFLVYGDNFHVRKLHLDVRFWLAFFLFVCHFMLLAADLPESNGDGGAERKQ